MIGHSVKYIIQGMLCNKYMYLPVDLIVGDVDGNSVGSNVGSYVGTSVGSI